MTTYLPSASGTGSPYANGTATVSGTGAGPSATQSGVPMEPSNAGSRVGGDVLGVAVLGGLFAVLAV